MYMFVCLTVCAFMVSRKAVSVDTVHCDLSLMAKTNVNAEFVLLRS